MKHKFYWLASFVALVLFTAYAVIGVFGFGTNQAYAEALSHGNMTRMSKHFVVVNDDKTPEGVGGMLQNGEAICSLTPTQAAELDAFFRVHTITVKVGGNPVEIATVSGRHLTKQELLDFLKASNQSLDCQVVGMRHLFFLPIIPQIS